MKSLVDTIKKGTGAATKVASACSSSNPTHVDYYTIGPDNKFSYPSTRGILENAVEAPIKFFDADIAGTGRQSDVDFSCLIVVEPLLNHQDFRSWQNRFRQVPRITFGGCLHDSGVTQTCIHLLSPELSPIKLWHKHLI